MVVLDTRTPTDRDRFGVIAGSVHAPRTVLEWAVDPASGYHHPAVRGFDQRLVVVCHEGYSSSLAAQSLRRLGFHRATDLVGGVAGVAGRRPAPRGAGPRALLLGTLRSGLLHHSAWGDALHGTARSIGQPYGVQWAG